MPRTECFIGSIYSNKFDYIETVKKTRLTQERKLG